MSCIAKKNVLPINTLNASVGYRAVAMPKNRVSGSACFQIIHSKIRVGKPVDVVPFRGEIMPHTVHSMSRKCCRMWLASCQSLRPGLARSAANKSLVVLAKKQGVDNAQTLYPPSRRAFQFVVDTHTHEKKPKKEKKKTRKLAPNTLVCVFLLSLS